LLTVLTVVGQDRGVGLKWRIIFFVKKV
jgi:hypothetical protein